MTNYPPTWLPSKFKHSTQMMMLIVLAMTGMTVAQERCTDTKATLQDGFLDMNIYYGSFTKASNSFLKFKNPFTASNPANITQGAVSFWLRFPDTSPSALNATILDCEDQIRVLIQDGQMRFSITQNQTRSNGVQLTTMVTLWNNRTLFGGDLTLLMQWNHYALSFRDRTLRVHINGIMAGETTLNNTVINPLSNTCYLGNSARLSHPLTGHLRHLLFSNQGFNRSQVITTQMRSLPLPNDTSILAYYAFEKDSTQQLETYYKKTDDSKDFLGVEIVASGEPEFVCYCTQVGSGYLKLSNQYRLRAMDMTVANVTLGGDGATIRFQIFPQTITNTNDVTILSIVDYADVVLTNGGTRLKVNLYANTTGVVAESAVLFNSLLRFNFWATYELRITRNEAILNVDGRFQDRQGFNSTLPTRRLPKISLLPQANSPLTYLINSLTILDSANSTIYERVFTQNVITPALSAQSGRISYESNNRLCNISEMYSPSKYISGDTCLSRRVASIFSTQTAATALTGSLRSSLQNMTFELWYKETTSQSEVTTNPMVILENIDGRNTLIQVAIIAQTADTRLIRIQPQTSSRPASQATLITSGLTEGRWMHMSVVSDKDSIRVNLFNHTSKQMIQATASNMNFIQYGSNLNTSLGSSIGGANKFRGLLKEIRIWNGARSDADIELMRYSTASQRFSDVTSSATLMHHFRLNEGLSYSSLQDSVIQTPLRFMTEKSPSLSSFAWQDETGIVVCGHGYYFDGQCCKNFNLTGIDFQMTYRASGSSIDLTIINSIMNQTLFRSVFADFTVVNVGYNFSRNYTQQVSRLLSANRVKQISVHTSLIRPLLFSITVQANIYSIYDMRMLTITRTLLLKCPSFYLTLNDQPIQDDDSYLISSSTNHFINATVQLVDNVCYNQATKTQQVIPITKPATWTHNNSRITVANAYDLSSNDGFSAVQRPSVANQSSTRLTATIRYNNTSTTERIFLDLGFTPISINNGFNTTSAMRNYLIGQAVQFQFSNSNITKPLADNTNYQLYYSVKCPMEIFRNITHYNRLCRMNGSSFNLATTANQNLSIKYSQKYLFTFTVGISGSYIMKNLDVNASFYQDGTGIGDCPQLKYVENYFYDKVNDYVTEIEPEPYLYCLGNFYEIQSMAWTVSEFVSKRVITAPLAFDASRPISFFLRRDNANLQRVAGQTILLMNGRFTYRQADATNYIGTTTSSFNRSVVVTLNATNIMPQIQLMSWSKQILSSPRIAFTEQNVTLDASTSYDPDNATAQLQFQWTCPEIIENCSSLQTGTRNNSLLIDVWTRFRSNLAYNQNYTFSVRVWAPNNALRIPQNASFSISFLPPSFNETNTALRNTTCETLNLTSPLFTSVTLPTLIQDKVITLTRNNFSNISFAIDARIDNGSTPARSPCGGGNVSSQVILLHLFDNLTTTQPSIIFRQAAPSSIQRLVNFSYSLSSLSQLEDLPPGITYMATVYMFTQRSGSTRTFVNQMNVWFKKGRAGLIAKFKEPQMEVDKYEDLIVDASASFDEETESSSGLRYKWSCPSADQARCNSITSSRLIVSYSVRQSLSLNEVGVDYVYGVQVSDSRGRTSDTTKISVFFTKKEDYSSCVNVTYSGSYYGQDFEQSNRTIYLEYDMKQDILIQMTVQTNCSNVRLQNPVWVRAEDNSTVFWRISNNDSNRISISPSEIKGLNPGANTPLNYSQAFSMGDDSTPLFYYNTFVNFFLNKPELISRITGKSIVILGNDTQISLDASSSQDPVNESMTIQWNCPSTFGGNNCSQSFIFTIDLVQFQANQTEEQMKAIVNKAYRFYTVLMSADGERQITHSYIVFFSDGLAEPYSLEGVKDCTIITNNNKSDIAIDKTNTFQLSCPTQFLTDVFFANNYHWNISGLSNITDYYVLNNILYVRPYSAAKLTSRNIFTKLSQRIQVTQAVVVNQTRRILQDTAINKGVKFLDTDIPDGNQTQDNNGTTNSTNSTTNITIEIESPDIYLGSSIPIRRNILTFGDVVITGVPDFTAYTSNFTYNFLGFVTNSKSQIYFQLRAFQLMYSANIILIPLKPFTEQSIRSYYTNTSMPVHRDLMFDFFDGAFKYLGSYNLYQQDSIRNLKTGSLQFNEYNRLLFPIVQKTLTAYPQTQQGFILIERDINRLVNYVEMLASGRVHSSFDTSSSYAQMISAYLKLNLGDMLARYDSDLSFDIARSKAHLQKQVLLILYNLIDMNSGIEDRTLQVLDIFEAVTSDYDLMIANSGDPELVRSMVLFIERVLTIQVADSNLQNKNTHIARLDTVEQKVASNDLKQAVNSSQSVIQVNSDTISRTIVQISDTQTPISIVNNLNSIETVTLNNQQLLFSLGVRSLITEFSPERNATSALKSSLTIEAFDAQLQRMSVDLSQTTTRFNIRFHLNETIRSMISSSNSNTSAPFNYTTACAFYDFNKTNWSSSGVQTIGFDQSNGIADCASSHLSQFSFVYSRFQRSINNNQTNNTNNTNGNNTNNNTNGNNTNNTNGNNTNNGTKVLAQEGTFYEVNSGRYVAAIVITSVGVFFLVFIQLCFKYDSNKVKGVISSDKKYPICLRFWSALKIYHPLFAAFISLKSATYAVPKIYHQLTLWSYIFAITISTVIATQYVVDDQLTSSQALVYAIVFELILLVLRPAYYHLVFGLYHLNTQASINEGAGGAQRVIQESAFTDMNNASVNNRRAEPYKVRNSPQQYEGGESEEEEVDDSSDNGGVPGSDRHFHTKSNDSQMHQEQHLPIPKANQRTPLKQSQGPKFAQENLKSSRVLYQNGVSPNYKIGVAADNVGSPRMSDPPVSPKVSDKKEKIIASAIVNQSPLNNRSNLQDINEVIQLDGEADGPIRVSPKYNMQASAANQRSAHRDFDPIEDRVSAPQRNQSSAQKQKPSQDNAIKIKDIEIEVESEHNFQGLRCCLLLFQLLILLGLMIATFAIMNYLETETLVLEWIYVVLGVVFIYLLFDALRILVFALLYTGSNSESGCVKFSAFLFLGNASSPALQSLQFELQELQ